jgi:hypothetical protein
MEAFEGVSVWGGLGEGLPAELAGAGSIAG